MRQLAEADRIRRFMHSLGAAAPTEARVYFTGGASAVLMGWRASTIDVDMTLVPDRDDLLRVIPALKQELQINVELVSPADFIPELAGWQDRSVFVAHEGRVNFYHYDFYAQALAKIERGHSQDRQDVRSMLETGVVLPGQLRELFETITPRLFRHPAVDPDAFRRALEEVLSGGEPSESR